MRLGFRVIAISLVFSSSSFAFSGNMMARISQNSPNVQTTTPNQMPPLPVANPSTQPATFESDEFPNVIPAPYTPPPATEPAPNAPSPEYEQPGSLPSPENNPTPSQTVAPANTGLTFREALVSNATGSMHYRYREPSVSVSLTRNELSSISPVLQYSPFNFHHRVGYYPYYSHMYNRNWFWPLASFLILQPQVTYNSYQDYNYLLFYRPNYYDYPVYYSYFNYYTLAFPHISTRSFYYDFPIYPTFSFYFTNPLYYSVVTYYAEYPIYQTAVNWFILDFSYRFLI